MKNPYFRKASLSAVLLSLVFLTNSCKKTASTTTTSALPTITTVGLIINLTSTTAQSGGTITSIGGSYITEIGVCYSSTNKAPNTLDNKVTTTLTSTATIPVTYATDLTGLTANTTYYVRAYAINSGGIAYGNAVTFTTVASLSGVSTTISTLAGNGAAGYANGSGSAALFNYPMGIATDASNNIFVADSYNNRIRSLTTGGLAGTIAGNGTPGYSEGAALTAEFYGPSGVAADGSGNIYVADFGNNVIRKITAAGVVSTFAGNGTAGFVNSTTAASAEFNNPAGVAVDASGNVYVADHGNNAIRKITQAGVVTTLAGVKTAGYVNATGTAAYFNNPTGVAVDAAGIVYVADLGNSAIRKITAAGIVTTIAGGPTQPTLLNLPVALALDKQGNIFIADEGGRILECTTSNVLYTLAGTVGTTGLVNGAGTTALFNNPQGIAVDSNNNIYVSDQDNSSIRKVVVVKTP
ncbi:hypothetical protein KXD93_25010 [Mucilaginibacter sp. BJC16-A38]|uniref:NHL repeat-containing protein n=1 Tax=Mucilaginibacter phenanthrenivorans TaxID=1234842 RepID=UPI00215755ED|nr:NHL repeat-containing protein [Mucilaginibacter phenanthrenivorans]MCR8560942.1 hypothetical protein [Mucilaginibacter phenanthrenivorans]